MALSKRFSLDDTHHFPTNVQLVSLLATFASKAISVTVLAPFNFVENRYQVMGEMKRNGLIKELYKGYSNCIATSIKE